MVAMLVSLLVGCPTPYQPPTTTDTSVDSGTDSDTETPPECTTGETRCRSGAFQTCEESFWEDVEACEAPTGVCDDVLGCLTCDPGRKTCASTTEVQECLPDGSAEVVTETCGALETCEEGRCVDPCDPGLLRFSYLGCDFLSVTTSNPSLSQPFHSNFAVVVGNPASNHPTTVTVSRGGAQVAQQVVQPGATTAIELPMVQELRGAVTNVQVPAAAYEVSSDQPVFAYQFNPLDFTKGPQAFSFSNDASLLLPEHVLTETYRVPSQPTWGIGQWAVLFVGFDGSWAQWYPGFVAITATEDATDVTFTANGQVGGGVIGPLASGQSQTVTLNRGDVLQLTSKQDASSTDLNYCTSQGFQVATEGQCQLGGVGTCLARCNATGWDLTGSLVESTKPVAVFSGHSCANMPFDKVACDHLEEMVMPVETWGTQVVMSAPAHPTGNGAARAAYRVMSHTDGNAISFSPSVASNMVLNAGDHMDFQTDQDFVVSSGAAVLVSQHLLGQQALGGETGDPAMGTGIPARQYRTNYSLLTPSTFTSNYLNVIAPSGAPIVLDGTPVTGFVPITGGGWEVARLALTPGSHRIESTDGTKFGITSYGYAAYTSYLYPGGLNLER